MNFNFNNEIWYWRGPAPFYFVTIPTAESALIKSVSNLVTYGWGVIPVSVKIGQTSFKTSLFPKEEHYIVPLKASVRQAEDLDIGMFVDVAVELSL